MVEERITQMIPQVAIVRLPGIFGPGLKKNVIYDLIHDNNLRQVHPGGVFHYYDLRRFSDDIDRAWLLGCSILNVSTAPFGTGDILPGKELGGNGTALAGYDMLLKDPGA